MIDSITQTMCIICIFLFFKKQSIRIFKFYKLYITAIEDKKLSDKIIKLVQVQIINITHCFFQFNKRNYFQTNRMEYLESIVKQFATDIVRSRRYNYSQDSLYTFLENHPSINCQTYRIQNKRQESIETILFQPMQSQSSTCIIYAHGLGSNKIQILPIVRQFQHLSYHICAFDFSGSGRSQGQYTTYGLRQQDDLIAVLAWLDSMKKFQRYILWGRSMGGVSVVLSQSQHMHPKLQCIILDSPFSSFQKVSIELASRKSFIPSFMIGLMIEPLKKHFQSSYPFNPFNINICKDIKNLNTKILLMYSKLDNIVDHEHSLLLKSHCKKIPFQIELNEDHNAQRSKDTINKIINFIQDSIRDNVRKKRQSQSRNRGISLTSKQKYTFHKRSNSLYKSTLNNESIQNMKQSLKTESNILTQIKSVSYTKKPLLVSNQLQNSLTHFNSISINNSNTNNIDSLKNSRITETKQSSNKKRKISTVNSIYQNILQNKLVKQLHKNQEISKHGLNFLRKNRFR